jgi:hypothetical protein
VEDEALNTVTPPKSPNIRLRMGNTACVTDFVKEITSKQSGSGKYFKKHIIETFVSFSTREIDIYGLEPVSGTLKARHILRSPILQHKVRIGRTKIADFLNSVEFEDGAATLDAVVETCVQVVKADKAFRRSNMGKKVARALRTLEQAG